MSGLLERCSQSSFYDRDLSDLVPVLVEKLSRSRPDPLKRAKEELGLVGERAFPALALAFHDSYSDIMRSALLENVVDALTFNSSAESHKLLMEALQHPQESVRSKALDGLARLARSEDFEILARRLEIETPELRRQSVTAMFQADRRRAEQLFLDFISQGLEKDLWVSAIPRFAASQDPGTVERCARLFEELDPQFAPHLAATAAKGGHGAALEYLRAQLNSEEPQIRLTTITALQRAGLVDELEGVLLRDSMVEARAIAAAAVAGAEPTEARRSWLRAALSDPSTVVQAEALSGLCAQSDPASLSQALAQLDGETQRLQQALQALREPMRRDPDLARAAFDRLLQRNALEEHRPIQQRVATFKAMGQVPLPEAARFLHDVGVSAVGELLESLRAHDWLMIQAGNTGIPGREYLAEALRSEEDPLRRIDLIDAVGSSRDELARTALLEWIEDHCESPLEKLFAASVAVKIGPSWEVGPRLKRVAFAMQGPGNSEARAGLQCLLWLWY